MPLVYRTAIYKGRADRGTFAGVNVRVGVEQPIMAVFICLWCFLAREKLKRLAERLLRLVMLVSVSFVKPVRPLADHVRPDVHPPAAAPARPFLGRFQKLRSRSRAALAFCNDQTVHFGSDVALQ